MLGGGVVPGSMVLLGGEPGAGKSTLLLQVAARLQSGGHAALYVSGEESPLQVKLRAERLTDSAGDVALLCETNLETILSAADAVRPARARSSTRSRPSLRAISKARPATSGRSASAPPG